MQHDANESVILMFAQMKSFGACSTTSRTTLCCPFSSVAELLISSSVDRYLSSKHEIASIIIILSASLFVFFWVQLYFCLYLSSYVLNRLLHRGKPEEGEMLFESEVFTYPGFIEFDDVNSKVLTFSAKQS